MRHLLHAEWTKFRTVRGWVIGMACAAAAIVGLGLLPGSGGSCGTRGPGSECVLPVGPEGQEVTDAFTFVHQPLTGDGSITARISSMTGMLPPAPGSGQARQQLAPWAKAGLILKDGTRQGSTYVAVMLTGENGVRMQHNYVHDRAGQPVASSSSRWLRLTRTAQKVQAEESADGVSWTTVGAVNLAGLPSTVQAGLFVASPQWTEAYSESFGANGAAGAPTQATTHFDNVSLAGSWTVTRVGDNTLSDALGEAEQTGENSFSVTGTGDIAPAVAGAAGLGTTVSETLLGTFAGLIFVVVISAMFVTAEYRRSLIRTTLSASPSRGRVLLAKAGIVGSAGFLAGIVAAAIVVTFGQQALRDNGVYVHPASTATELRVIAGTGALLGVAAVMSVGLGALLRRGTTAVTVAIVTIVLPYLLAMTVLPAGAAQWLLRIAPAAAFSLQQTSIGYQQVANLYTPSNGYFPLPAWAGFAVLAGWAALALALAAQRLRGQDA